MKVLFLGDIVGRSGRAAVERELPGLLKRDKVDGVIANGENAAGGTGITRGIASELMNLGVGCITLGNHTFDQRGTSALLESEPCIIRPANYPRQTPGRGSAPLVLRDGRKILVVNLMGRVFMSGLDCPFQVLDTIVAEERSRNSCEAIIVDFHAEATSESMALAHEFDGKVTAILGTHTHIPTADERILPGGTATMSDVGMCGDYNSVLGMEKSEPVFRFRHGYGRKRFEPARGQGTVCGVFIEFDARSGKALSIDPVRRGPLLTNTSHASPGSPPPAAQLR